jgi:GDPmannose 4,6-dehydratase
LVFFGTISKYVGIQLLIPPGVVIITGVSGQDGHFLTKLLTDRGIRVVGLTRNVSFRSQLFDNKNSHLVCVKDYSSESLLSIFQEFNPSHVVNFAGQSSVADSWNSVDNTWEANFGIVK